MPLRRDIQFLRERAGRLREIVGAHRTAFSNELRNIAAELDRQADRFEKSNPPAG